jgi:hypothetical protein
MEDWQEWQIRADRIAAELGVEVDGLESTFLGDDAGAFNYRSFWPKFRDLKERVRVAPAIRLEAKLDLERRLRVIGSRAYKAQEVVYARSAERKSDLLSRVADLRERANRENNPRALRTLRREFDQLREEFDTGASLVPPDRQAVWDAWREANQFAWQRLVDLWGENEASLRETIAAARQQLERGNAAATRQAVGKFFDLLKTREAKQDAVNAMKAEVDEIRREADLIVERASSQRAAAVQAPSLPAADAWRSELERNRVIAARLSEEVAVLERKVQDTDSILEQAMVRGTLVDKRRKLSEIERTNRTLEQRIEQTEEAPLIPSA